MKNLQNEYPNMAKEFYVEKNNCTPENVFIYSKKNYWWK